MALTLSNIGHLYMQLGDYPRARVDLERARAAAESVGDLTTTAGVLYNLSTLSRHEGKLDDAERVQRQPEVLHEKSGDRIGMVETLTALADLAQLRGRAIDALPLAGRAVALASESRLLNQLWRAQLLEGRLLEELGKAADARAAYEAAIITIERLRASTAGGDSARRQYLEERVGPYYALASLHARAGRNFEALAVVEQSRARTLIDIVSSGHTPIRSLTAAQQDRERDLTQRCSTSRLRSTPKPGRPPATTSGSPRSRKTVNARAPPAMRSPPSSTPSSPTSDSCARASRRSAGRAVTLSAAARRGQLPARRTGRVGLFITSGPTGRPCREAIGQDQRRDHQGRRPWPNNWRPAI